MTATTVSGSWELRRGPAVPWVPIGALAALLLLLLLRGRIEPLLPELYVFPRDWHLPLAAWTTAVMQWLIDSFFDVTRAVTAVLKVPLDIAYGLLERGFTFEIGAESLALPPLSWVGVVATVALIGHALGGWRLALLGGLCFLYLALFGQWASAMRTLALVVISVPLGVLIGLFIGILGYRRPVLNRALVVPLLDVAQATPQYAYLVPMLMLFGNNPVSAMLATLAFAVPPMVRATTLALQQVPGETRDFGVMAGCTRRQQLWRILVPSARPLLMVGVNQVINMTFNMVIIASMIGAGGLGYDVLLALRALKVGAAFEAGIALVLLAMVLDRLSQAAAVQAPAALRPGAPFHHRHPYLAAAGAALAATTVAGVFVPELSLLPKSATITTAPVWDSAIKWIVVNFFDAIEAGRTWLLIHVLKPVKAFLLGLPWLAVVALLALAGLRLGGWRLALLVGGMALFPALAGLWEVTMTTVYLVGLSSIVACAIGMPLGVLAARNRAADRVLAVVVDTLQTIPAFVYLIPAVMLFRVGDVAAMIGIVLYAVTPAIRYTNHGIKQVAPTLIEAGTAAGCSRRQLLWRVQLPLALPEIMLGINQVVFLALSMDIIAAMIGTSDLGQEVFKALAKADAGRGVIAGLAVACIGIVADRLIGAWSRRVRDRFGLV